MAGLGALALLIFAIYLGFNDLAWNVVAVAAAACVVYFLFFAPADCRAAIRGGRVCRNNAKGFVGGCHVQQHKKQTVGRLLRAGPAGEGRPARYWEELFGSPRQVVSTVGTATSVVALIAAFGAGALGG